MVEIVANGEAERSKRGLYLVSILLAFVVGALSQAMADWIPTGDSGGVGYDATARSDVASLKNRVDLIDTALRGDERRLTSLETEFDRHQRDSGRGSYRPPIGSPLVSPAK